MVPGQSFILYSRLHLVLQNTKLLHGLLWLISITTVLMIVPMTSLTFSTTYLDTFTVNYGFNVMERLQLTWFCVQECLLSTLYIREAMRLLRLDPHKNRRRSQIEYELIVVNAATIAMDIVLLVVEYVGLYIIQVTLKTAVYSLKLKLEFAVLSRMVESVCGPLHGYHGSSSDDSYFPDFVNPDRVPADLTHAAAVRQRQRDMSSLTWQISRDDYSHPHLPTAPHYRSARHWWPT